MGTANIYVKEKNSDRGFYAPWLPDDVEYKSGDAVTIEYDIMNRGPVSINTGSGLRELAWKGVFPGDGRDNFGMLNGSEAQQPPSYYHSILSDWIKNGTLLTVAVYGYPINFDAILTAYSANVTGAFGDMEYSVRFQEKRELTLWPINPTSTAQTATSEDTPAEDAREVAATAATYTIKSGDSLWSIAASQLGDGTRYKEIYELNKDALEAEAQKHGHHCTLSNAWIFPGTIISLPDK